MPLIPVSTYALDFDTYVVQKNDSLWKIAVKYKIGVKEIIQANSQIENVNMIYPGDKINIPNIDTTKGIEEEVRRIVNKERSKMRLRPLLMDWELQRVARVKSCDMVQKNYFSHQSPTYGSPFDMMKNYGIRYKSAGENIASGQNSPSEVMESWMNSQGHRENILKSNFTHIGVGYCKGGPYGHTWTQQFIEK